MVRQGGGGGKGWPQTGPLDRIPIDPRKDTGAGGRPSGQTPCGTGCRIDHPMPPRHASTPRPLHSLLAFFPASAMNRTPDAGPPPAPDDPSDEELDAFIRTRLQLAGIDLSVLPEEDPDAPADQARIRASVRRFLRGTVRSLSAFELDPNTWPPALYPSQVVFPDVDEAGPVPGREGDG